MELAECVCRPADSAIRATWIFGFTRITKEQRRLYTRDFFRGIRQLAGTQFVYEQGEVYLCGCAICERLQSCTLISIEWTINNKERQSCNINSLLPVLFDPSRYSLRIRSHVIRSGTTCTRDVTFWQFCGCLLIYVCSRK
jgi:hypothetical protein